MIRRCLLLVPAVVALGWGQAAGDNPGPPVGAQAPAFQLSDQNGQSRDLHSLAGPKGLMLVFVRSADW